jgi:16S rRNA (guanine527-N7)-methyltransferase
VKHSIARGHFETSGTQVELPVVSRETEERLSLFVALLLKWNPVINLISRKDEAQIRQRHVNDALQLMKLLPPDLTEAVDLGSGAGFPGLICAIATGVHFHLIESDHRKSAFLIEAARVTGAAATIHNARIESVVLPPVRVVTARALAPLVDLIGLAQPFLTTDGVLIAPKGGNVEQELMAARAKWDMQVRSVPSATHPTATILTISEARRFGPHS